MLKSIKGLKIKGAFFSNEATLDLFSKGEDRVSLIFGRNGSGKSTISRAVAKIIGNETADIISAQFVNYDGRSLSLPEEDARRVYIFNEDYTNSNIRIREDGLGTIVMFGDTIGIAETIEKLEQEKKVFEDKFIVKKEELEKYNDPNNSLSPQYHNKRVKTALQGDASWAGRERLITGSRQNASVTEATITDIMLDIPIESHDEIVEAYNSSFRKLEAARSQGDNVISSPMPIVSDYKDSLISITNLLKLLIEKPSLSEREQKLLIMAQDGRQNTLYDMRRDFSEDSTDDCPYCLQPVTADYKQGIIQSIEKVLNKDVENHKAELKTRVLPVLNISFSEFDVADRDMTEKCKQALTDINEEISKINKTIGEKINDPFTPITYFSSDLPVKTESLCLLITELEEIVKQYNSLFSNIPSLQRSLKLLNKKQGYYEINNFHADYLKQKEESECREKELKLLDDSLEELKQKLEKLNQQKRNVQIAIEYINKGLQYVFFSSDRLMVVPNGDNYAILSNEKPVKPKNISVGERNILALCYFFTEILNNTDGNDIYKNEYLIVLDDPVSSFDLENRVGIISFLKSQMIKILRGNINSKIILLSHDLLTIYDIEKALKEIANQIKTVASGGKDTKMVYRIHELDNKKVIDFRHNRNEYSQLIKVIYMYAVDASNDYELFIGNIMRRALEAFGTFEYRKGIDEISCDHGILMSIDADKRDYFENLMYRLILHGESHLRDRANLLTDNNFFATTTKDEKKRTARDILCFMYLLNKNHINAHFTAMKDEIGVNAINIIEEWIKNISTQSGDNNGVENNTDLI